MKSPSEKDWLKIYFFIMFFAIWVAYALRAWAMPEHQAIYVLALVTLGLAAAGARVVAARTAREPKGGDGAVKQRELAALAEEMLERARRSAR